MLIRPHGKERPSPFHFAYRRVPNVSTTISIRAIRKIGSFCKLTVNFVFSQTALKKPSLLGIPYQWRNARAHAGAAAQSICSQGQTGQEFAFTGTEQTFSMPAGVTQVLLQAFGAQGGQGYGQAWAAWGRRLLALLPLQLAPLSTSMWAARPTHSMEAVMAEPTTLAAALRK